MNDQQDCQHNRRKQSSKKIAPFMVDLNKIFFMKLSDFMIIKYINLNPKLNKIDLKIILNVSFTINFEYLCIYTYIIYSNYK